MAAALALAASLVGAAALVEHGPPPTAAERPLAGALATVRANRGTTGLFGVALARYAILGALDVLLVVLAFEALDLGSGGVGILNALLGAGALASMAVATVVVRRARLAPWLAIGLLAAALLCACCSAPRPRCRSTVVVLPLLGLCAALFDGIGRMLLQRSVDPAALASLFALVELVGGIGLLLGSVLAQVVVAVADVHVGARGPRRPAGADPRRVGSGGVARRRHRRRPRGGDEPAPDAPDVRAAPADQPRGAGPHGRGPALPGRRGDRPPGRPRRRGSTPWSVARSMW